MGTTLSVEALYREYGGELADLSARLRTTFLRMRREGIGATFSDVDGELLYLLVRKLRPAVVYEISPDCGYSTNYLAAAIEATGEGRLLSFEIEPTKSGRPTLEQIRRNLVHPSLADYVELVIGDASQRTAEFPNPDLVLIDSCHDAWFARWYIEELFPRVRQLAFVQDVTYHDRPEYSEEAAALMTWLREAEQAVWTVGTFEASQDLARWRSGLAPRRPYENNSIVIPFGEDLFLEGAAPLPSVESPFGHDASLDGLGLAELDALHQGILPRPIVPNGHRRWLRLGHAYGGHGLLLERDRCYRRALAEALFTSPEERAKGLAEISRWMVREGRPGLLATALALVATHGPGALLSTVSALLAGVAREVRRRLRSKAARP